MWGVWCFFSPFFKELKKKNKATQPTVTFQKALLFPAPCDKQPEYLSECRSLTGKKTQTHKKGLFLVQAPGELMDVKTCLMPVVVGSVSCAELPLWQLYPALETNTSRSHHPSLQEVAMFRFGCPHVCRAAAAPAPSSPAFIFVFHFPSPLAFFGCVLTVSHVHGVTPAAGACFTPLLV